MFWIELIIVLAIIFIGVRVGGTFLAMAGGIGMFIMTFILHVTPSDPPITVILIMIAVICAAATMQACGGLDYLVRIAEKILRKNPKMITVLAPVVAYIFTFMCGTGHIVYSLLPVINEIAIETGVRPERPISASIVSSQQLTIVPGKDYVTLVTCTPYAVNTHRLLVRGYRIPYEEAVEKVPDEKIAIGLPFQMKVLFIGLFILFLILFFCGVAAYVKKRKKKREKTRREDHVSNEK